MAKQASKPKWPHSDTVKMTAHRNGQWCKKIRQRLHYFGPWNDPDGARDRYLENASRLHAGLPVETSPTGVTTVADCFNRYLAYRRPDVRPSRSDTDHNRDRAMGPTMWRRYQRAGRAVAEALGRNKAADKLTPQDFAVVKEHLSASMVTTTMANHINAIRSVFTWAYDQGHIEQAPRFGDDFRARGLKRAVRRSRREKGKKLLDGPMVRALLAEASPQMRAMILLGINAGFYAVDCADLRHGDIDLDRGVVMMARFKTEVDRVAPLWTVTVDAIREAMATRPAPRDEAHADRVFITRRGYLWVKSESANHDDNGGIKSVTHGDYVGQEFRKLFTKAKIERPEGCGFSWLRHTFYTVGRRTKDYDAVSAIMGHAGAGMIEHYLEDVELADLRVVVEYVRQWLYPDADATTKTSKGEADAKGGKQAKTRQTRSKGKAKRGAKATAK
ncbi:tyrosine-type recombinase/integrase [Phycisphaerales bacterium AB-hyl4]|uniref:Tyrosine-type recombinase/integrase n=1 Tax=Natronomicrosphaera hydrolytica TaxID=3242702 RepID=A0ABV4U0I2_9BACT